MTRIILLAVAFASLVFADSKSGYVANEEANATNPFGVVSGYSPSFLKLRDINASREWEVVNTGTSNKVVEYNSSNTYGATPVAGRIQFTFGEVTDSVTGKVSYGIKFVDTNKTTVSDFQYFLVR